MGLLNQQGKKGDKKSKAPKNQGTQSKFISKGSKQASGGFAKKPMTGGSQRGS